MFNKKGNSGSIPPNRLKTYGFSRTDFMIYIIMLYYYEGYYILHPTLLRFAPTPYYILHHRGTTFCTLLFATIILFYLFMVKFVVPPTTFCTYILSYVERLLENRCDYMIILAT